MFIHIHGKYVFRNGSIHVHTETTPIYRVDSNVSGDNIINSLKKLKINQTIINAL